MCISIPQSLLQLYKGKINLLSVTHCRYIREEKRDQLLVLCLQQHYLLSIASLTRFRSKLWLRLNENTSVPSVPRLFLDRSTEQGTKDRILV